MEAATKEELWNIFEKGSENRHVASTSKSVTKILFILKLSRSTLMQTVLKFFLGMKLQIPDQESISWNVQ